VKSALGDKQHMVLVCYHGGEFMGKVVMNLTETKLFGTGGAVLASRGKAEFGSV
jgi:hypothetical protein